MINRVDLKSSAKESLKGKWAEAIKVLLILIIIDVACNIIFGNILHFGISEYEMEINGEIVKAQTNYISPIINCLITFGYLSFFLKISRNEDVTCNELFSKVNMAFKYILMSILIGIVVLIGTICLIVPGIILGFGLTQTSFILLDNPDMGVIDAMKLSWKMMKGYKMDYFILSLSFLGWAILLIFTLFIGYFWLVPYMQVTMCNFYNKVKESYNEKAE